MAREVFVDTSGIYALADRRDPAHRSARKCLEQFRKEKFVLLLTDYIVDEALTLALVRSGRPAALCILDLVEGSRFFRLVGIGGARFEAAKAYFRKHIDQGYSFTDCTSFVVMKEQRVSAALTTDRHFEKAGFEALL